MILTLDRRFRILGQLLGQVLGQMNIKPLNNNGSIRIRFSFEKVRYNINPQGEYSNPIDIARANLICSKIELDILLRNFDASLKKYTENYPQLEFSTEKSSPVVIKEVKTYTLIEVWDLWVESLDISEDTKLNHYRPLRIMIGKVKPKPLLDCSKWLLEASGNHMPSTYNGRLRLLRSCLVWAIEQELTTLNPYAKLKKRKIEQTQVKPFTIDEMKNIINGFGKIQPAYKDFVTFLFLTGCRPSEAIGIQWRRIDFERGEITICDSLPKTVSEGHKRKSTKTGSVTVLKINEGLRSVLSQIELGSPEDLVFKSSLSKNGIINLKNFWVHWGKVLTHTKIEYRKPYTTRHTLASHAIDQGLSLVEVAYILGHTDTSMVSKVYGHMINKPDLPDLKL